MNRDAIQPHLKESSSIGLYVKTHRRDYHLAKALLASLQRHCPTTQITIIADDDFSQSQLWGQNVLQLEDPFLQSLRGYFRKLWIFFGPYERFVYLDADTLVLRSVEPLIERVRIARTPFVMVCAESKMIETWHSGDINDAKLMATRHVGDLDHLAEFDARYDWTINMPFNSGFIASHRGALSLERFKQTFVAAQKYCKDHELPALATARAGLFMADQGLLNYLVSRDQVPLEFLTDIFFWGGSPVNDQMLASMVCDPDPLRYVFVHWAGCPRPGFLKQNVPAGKVWVQRYKEFFQTHGGMSSLMADAARHSILDTSESVRKTLRRIKVNLQRTVHR